MNNPVLENVKNDTLYFGMALIVSQLLVGGSLLARDWQVTSLLTLIGFAAYQVLVAQLLNTGSLASGRVKAALDDVLKFGTAWVVIRLMTGQSLTDAEWLKETGGLLLGLVLYNLAVTALFDTSKLEYRWGSSLNDILRIVSAFVVMNWVGGKPFDRQFALKTTGWATGFVLYRYVLE